MVDYTYFTGLVDEQLGVRSTTTVRPRASNSGIAISIINAIHEVQDGGFVNMILLTLSLFGFVISFAFGPRIDTKSTWKI